MNNIANTNPIELSKLKIKEILDYVEPEKIRSETYKDPIKMEEMLAISFLVSADKFRLKKLEVEQKKADFRDLFLDIIKIGRTAPASWTVDDVLHKLTEEHGELVTAIQIKRGKINKPMGESEFGECADVINCALDSVSKMNPTMTPEEIISELQVYIAKKSQKWMKILEASKS
jgi:NTP pyrophosphatase (non-canonical NTP hydrolase)